MDGRGELRPGSHVGRRDLSDGAVEDVCPADLNEDGEVTSVDLLMLLSVYGEPC